MGSKVPFSHPCAVVQYGSGDRSFKSIAEIHNNCRDRSFFSLLTAEASRFLYPANPFIGIIFGISIIALLWLEYKGDLSRVVAALLIFSVVSYLAAIWVTLPLYSALGRFLGPDFADDPFGPVVFTFAGYLGALIINAALLEKLNGLSGPQALATAAPWACGGAILGFIAEELSGPVGAAVAKLVGDTPSLDMGSNDYFLVFYSAYVIWQTGMLFLITWMVSRGESVPAGTQPSTHGR